MYCYTITHHPEIEWGDDAGDWDGGDGRDDIGPHCTPLTSLSEEDEGGNNKVKPRLIILFTRISLSLSLYHLPLSFLSLTK